jgi:hypothetical protein
MPKAKAGVLDGSRYLDIRALLGGEHVVRTTEVGKRPVWRPKGSTELMRNAEASTSTAAAANDIQEEGNQTSDEGDKDAVDKGTVDKDTVEAARGRREHLWQGSGNGLTRTRRRRANMHCLLACSQNTNHRECRCVPPWGFHCNSSLLQLFTCNLSKFEGKGETRKNMSPVDQIRILKIIITCSKQRN